MVFFFLLIEQERHSPSPLHLPMGFVLVILVFSLSQWIFVIIFLILMVVILLVIVIFSLLQLTTIHYHFLNFDDLVVFAHRCGLSIVTTNNCCHCFLDLVILVYKCMRHKNMKSIEITKFVTPLTTSHFYANEKNVFVISFLVMLWLSAHIPIATSLYTSRRPMT